MIESLWTSHEGKIVTAHTNRNGQKVNFRSPAKTTIAEGNNSAIITFYPQKGIVVDPLKVEAKIVGDSTWHPNPAQRFEFNIYEAKHEEGSIRLHGKTKVTNLDTYEAARWREHIQTENDKKKKLKESLDFIEKYADECLKAFVKDIVAAEPENLFDLLGVHGKIRSLAMKDPEDVFKEISKISKMNERTMVVFSCLKENTAKKLLKNLAVERFRKFKEEKKSRCRYM